MIIALVIIAGLIWGSFLNMLAYRLLSGESLLISRSFCPQCKKSIAWHDLLPLFSYAFLRGRCRACSQSISFLYPFIELTTALTALCVWLDYITMATPTPYYAALRAVCYALLFSGLIIATRTDLQAMVIPQVVMLVLAPLGLLASAMGVLPITWQMSLLGGALGYGILWLLGWCFKVALNKDGIGEGDMELLGMLGLFFGPVGVWAIMLTSSLSGIVVAVIYLLATGQGRNTRIPFGPFLCLGALVYFYAQPWFYLYLLG